MSGNLLIVKNSGQNSAFLIGIHLHRQPFLFKIPSTLVIALYMMPSLTLIPKYFEVDILNYEQSALGCWSYVQITSH